MCRLYRGGKGRLVGRLSGACVGVHGDEEVEESPSMIVAVAGMVTAGIRWSLVWFGRQDSLSEYRL